MENVPDIVDANSLPDEQTVESALRPKTLTEFIGQHRVREQLGLVLAATAARGGAADHRTPAAARLLPDQ
jgi:Holliday junction DNA helicase RuvB